LGSCVPGQRADLRPYSGDNVALPLHEIKRLDESAIRRKVYQVIREVIHQLFGRTLD
jgi:hypothetical protein